MLLFAPSALSTRVWGIGAKGNVRETGGGIGGASDWLGCGRLLTLQLPVIELGKGLCSLSTHCQQFQATSYAVVLGL